MKFRFNTEARFFEKADSDPNRRMRIAGVISTESRDRQDEVVLQRGLDFGDFLRYGHFNDNHKKGALDALGFPTEVKRFQKGDKLPDGTQAKNNLTWSEGALYDSAKGREWFDQARAMEKSGARNMGFSIEGKIIKREGPDRKIVAKASVQHIAITHVPVNADSRLVTLAKSLIAVEQGAELADDVTYLDDPEDLEKMMSMTGGGVPADNSSVAVGPMTGAGAGRIMTPRSVEGVGSPNTYTGKKRKKKLTKAVSREDGIAFVQAQLGCSLAKASNVFDLTVMRKHAGL